MTTTNKEICDVFDHDWEETYYGYKCKKCDLFIAFGCEPWIDPEDVEEIEEAIYG